MKTKWIVCFLIMCVSVFSGSSAFSKDDVVVPGTPAITMHAVDCHIRLLELALNTRLTVAQKNYFLEAIKEECSEMTAEARKEFLEATELVASMNELAEEQHGEIQSDLAKDFAESAAEVPDDPAAKMFTSISNESFRSVIQEGTIQVSLQALEAFVEFAAFVASPDDPVWFNASDSKVIQDRIMQSFSTFSADEKENLDDFHLPWFMIRAAWQGPSDAKKKESWRKQFGKIGLKSGEIPDVKKIRALLSTDIYGDLLDECINLGVDTLEWSPTTSFRVW